MEFVAVMYSLAVWGWGDVLLGSLWGSFVGSAVDLGSAVDFGSAVVSGSGSDLGSAETSLVGSGSAVTSLVGSGAEGSLVGSVAGSLVGSAAVSAEGSAVADGSGSAVVNGSPVGSGTASTPAIFRSLPKYLQQTRESFQCKGTLLIVCSC